MPPGTAVVSVSLTPSLRTRLDAEARRQRRSRSYLVTEAVEFYLAARDRDAFAEARRQTLREGLSLSAAERVGLSEELWRDLTQRHGPAVPWAASFRTFDEHERWRRGGGKQAGG